MTHESTARPTIPAQLRLPGEGLVLRDDREIAHWTPLASPFDLAAARAHLATARQARVDGPRIQPAVTTDGHLPPGEVLVIRRSANDRTASLGYSVGAAHRGRHSHLTGEPPIGAVNKGRPPTPRTWAHERP